MCAVLCYHGIDDNKRDIFSVSPDVFKQHLSFFITKYAVCTLRKASNDDQLIIMFDDGYKSIITHCLPIMESFGVCGVVAMPTGFIGEEGHLSEQDLIVLKSKGWDIISHTHIHADYSLHYANEDREHRRNRIKKDLITSKKILDQLLNQNTTALVWPYGAYDQNSIDIATQLGFTMMFGTQTNDLISRITIYRQNSLEDIERSLLGESIEKDLTSFSIIIPTYNRADILARNLQALTEINYPKEKMEVIVVDDGSSDHSVSVVESFEQKLQIKYLFQDDTGFRAGAARHKGALCANNDVLLFLDDDIVVPPNVLQVHNWIHSFSHTVGIGRLSGFNKVHALGIHEVKDTFPAPFVPELVRELKYMDCLYNLNRREHPWDCIYSTCVSIRREDYNYVGFDTTFEGYGYEDIEWGFRLWDAGFSFLVGRDAVCFHITDQDCRDPKRAYWITPESFNSMEKNITKMAQLHPHQDVQKKKHDFYHYLMDLRQHTPRKIRDYPLLHDHPLFTLFLKESAFLALREGRRMQINNLPHDFQQFVLSYTIPFLFLLPQDLKNKYALFFGANAEFHDSFAFKDHWKLMCSKVENGDELVVVITRQNIQKLQDIIRLLYGRFKIPIYLYYPELQKGQEDILSYYVPSLKSCSRIITELLEKTASQDVPVKSISWHYDYAKPDDLDLYYDHCKPEVIEPSHELPVISLIVLTHNRKDLFENTLVSIEKQRLLVPFELIVVDDGSEEDIKQSLNNIKIPTTYIRWDRHFSFEPGTPYNRAGPLRNLGAQHARGSLLVFLDGDLIVSQDFLDQHFINHKIFDVVVGRTVRERSGRDVREPFIKMCAGDIEKLPSYWTLFHSGNVSVKKNHFNIVGGFDGDFVYYGMEDEELGYKLYKKGMSFCYAYNAFAFHQYHPPEFVTDLIKNKGHHYNTTVFFKKHLDSEILERFTNLEYATHERKKNAHVLRIYDKSNDNVKGLSYPHKFVSKKELHEYFVSLQRNSRVVLMGGEVTIRNDFFDILSCATSHDIIIEIETNARIFSYLQHAKKLKQCNVQNVLVYCYGPNEKVHDDITQVKGSFQQMLAGITNLKSLGIGIALQLVITPYNYLYADEMISFTSSLGLPANHFAVYYDETKNIVDRDSFYTVLKYLLEKKEQNNSVKFKTGILGCQSLSVQQQQQSFMIYDVCRFCQIFDTCKGRPSFVRSYEIQSEKPEVLLIQPSYQPHWSCCEPTGLLTLAGYIRSKGYAVKIIDLNIQVEDTLFDYMHHHNPKIVGISMLSRQADRAYELGLKLKQQFPAISLVYGGVHPTICPHEFEEKSFVDYVVLGEGEKSFEQLCDVVIAGKGTPSQIKGIMYKENGKWTKTENAVLVDLDDLPIPAYDLVDLQAYNTGIHVRPFHKECAVHMLTSRGCPYNCTYCTSPFLFKHKVRFQSPDRIVNELEYLKNAHGITRIHFHDDDFLLHKPFVKELCALMKERNLGIRWICLSNIKTVVEHLDIFKHLAEAGCVGIEFGIESGDETVLRKIGKIHTNEDVLKVRKAMEKNDLMLMHLLIGYSVGETIDSPYKTVKLLYKGRNESFVGERIPLYILLEEEVMGHLARPSPATTFFEQAEKEGIVFASTWEDQIEERINFLPYSLLHDVPLPLIVDNLHTYLEKYKPIIRFFIEHNFYAPADSLKTTWSDIDDFLRFLTSLYTYCDSTRTVLEIMELFKPQDLYQEVAIGISYLSILRLVRSKNEPKQIEQISQTLTTT